MTQYTFRGNLNAARFPLVSTFQGRSIIIPQFDQNFQKLANFSGNDMDRDIGVPQIFYGHNIMPTAEGLQSVGFKRTIVPFTADTTDFDKAFILKNDDEVRGLLVPAGGKNYIYNATIGAWEQVSPHSPLLPNNTLITAAYLQGRTLFFYENIDCYEYDFAANTISVVTLTGLTVANIKGICSAINYLIAWDDDNQVYWSSLADMTDFTPSLESGAGSEKPNDLRGNIVAILPIAGGFVIYTTKNAVLASYSGNIRFPWIFKEIAGSQGIRTPEHVTWEANTAYHLVWSAAGLFKVEKTGAEPIFPELTDFISSRIFEDYDVVAETLTQRYLSAELSVKIVLIGTRYLVFSYGVTEGYFTHAVIVDLVSKRFGKIKLDHVDCFDWSRPNLFGVQTYDDLLGFSYSELLGTSYDEISVLIANPIQTKENIAFLQKNGSVQILIFDLGDFDASGVLFLGKFQMVRTKAITFLNLEVENVALANTNFSTAILTSFDGKNFTRSLTPMEVDRTDNSIKYGGRLTGQNLATRFLGSFNFVSVLMTVMNNGDR